MARYRATLAYDGTDFQGYQRQRDGVPTVQGTVEAALARIARHPVTVYGAGRTDTGVHAMGQVIAFDLDWPHGDDALFRAVNAYLPDSIALFDVQPAVPTFHPRFDAVRRAYQYTIVYAPHRQPLLRTRAWVQVAPPPDYDAMRRAAALLDGRRDYGALGKPPQGTNTVRTVYRSELYREERVSGQWLTYKIEADAFLYRMVRRIVGLLAEVGRGRLSPDDVAAMLDRGTVISNIKIAPPQGLILTRVIYPEAQPVGHSEVPVEFDSL